MSTTYGDVRNLVLYRVRALGGIGFEESFVAKVISLSEQTTNAIFKSIVSSYTLSCNRYRCLYNLREAESEGLKRSYEVLEVVPYTLFPTEFRRVTLGDLFGFKGDWFNNIPAPFVGGIEGFYCCVGRDIFISYPPLTSEPFYLSLLCVSDFDDLAEETDIMHIPDEDVPIAADIAEIVLLSSMRLTDVVAEKVRDLKTRIEAKLATTL
jgi:hypothetical protein